MYLNQAETGPRKTYNLIYNTFKYHVFAPMGRFQLELIYLYFPPSSHLLYVCFCLVGVEVTSVSWLGQLTVGV